MVKLSFLIDTLFRLLFLFLIIGALMTWIPNLPRYKDPYKTMLGICDLFFSPFRRIIPPLGGIDLSPILAFFILGFICNVIVDILVRFGL